MAAADAFVSIIITTYYRNDALERAIEAALSQTYSPVEVLVVDDSGSAHALETVDQYEEVTYVEHEENSGQITAWETGVDVSSGAYIQLHDDDDWIDPDKIERQVEALQQSESARVAYCGTSVFGDREENIRPGYEGDVLAEALGREMLAQTTTLLIERALVEDVFPLKKYGGATDIPLNIELATRSEFVYVDEPLVNRRITADSKGTSQSAWEARLEIVADYSEEYDSVDPAIKRRVLGNTYYMLGYFSLDADARRAVPVRMFLKAMYHRRLPHPRYLKGLLVSLLP